MSDEFAYDIVPFAFAIVQKGKIVYVNAPLKKLFLLDSGEELSRSGIKRLLTPDSYRKYQQEMKDRFDDGHLLLKLRCVKNGGEIFDTEAYITTSSGEEGERQYITFRDITEEKRLTETLLESSQRYQALFQNSHLAQAILRQGMIVTANTAFYRFFSLSEQTDLSGKPIADVLDPEILTQFNSSSKKILAGKLSSETIEHKAYKTEGVFFDSKLILTPVQAGSEKLLSVTFTDITTEKQEREELIAKANEWAHIDDLVATLGDISELQRLITTLPDMFTDVTRFHTFGMYLADSKGVQLELQNQKGLPDEITAKINILPFEEGIGGFLHKTLEPFSFETKRYPSFLPYRAVFTDAGFVKMTLIPLSSKGTLLGALLHATKNNEIPLPSPHVLALLAKHGGEALSRVLAFERLKRSEEGFRFAVENSVTTMYRLAHSGMFESLSRSIESLTGYTTSDFYRTQSLWLSLIHPDDKKLLLGRQTKLHELISPYTIEYRVRPKGKAAYRWVRDTLVPVKQEQENSYRYEGTLTDITEYKQRIEELSKIAEQHAIEQKLTDSTRMLSNMINTMDDVLIVSDLEGNIIEVNSAFEKMLGYSVEEAISSSFPQPWLNTEETGKYVLWMTNLKTGERLYDFDMLWKTKEGKLLAMSISSSFLQSVDDTATAVITIARDISERKQLSKELEERKNQVELLNRVMMAAETSTDINDIFSKICAEVKANIPFDSANISLIADPGTMVEMLAVEGIMSETQGMLIPIEQTISRFTVRGQKPVIIGDLDEYDEYKQLDSYKFEIKSQASFPIISKGRILGTFNIGSKSPNAFSEEETKGLQLIAQQLGVIIDRVRLFNKVTEDAGYIRNLLDSIDNVVYTIGKDHRILEVNRAWNDFIRAYNRAVEKEYTGKNLFDVLPDEELKLMLQKVIDDLLSGSVRYFSQELVLNSTTGKKTYQVTINPLVIERKITGLVISHSDITELRQTASELKKYSDRLLTLNWISMLTQASKNSDEILRTALPILNKAIEADAIVVYLKDNATNELVLSVFSTMEEHLLENAKRIPIENSATGKVMESRQPIFIQRRAYNDTRLIPAVRNLFKQANVEALGIIPLISHENVYGAMNVVYRAQNPFTDQLIQILTLACNQLGSTIESVQLYSQLQEQVDQLSVMYLLGQSLTSTLEIEKIFEIVVEQIQYSIPFENLAIGMYDEQKGEIKTSFEVSRYERNVQIFPKNVETHKVASLLSESQVVATKKTLVKEEGKTLLVPMLSKEKIIGIMSLTAPSPAKYTHGQIRLLESIANLVAIALEKGKLYHETILKTQEIERRNRELDDFTYVVSHDLKEPLISIEGFSRIIESDYTDLIVGEGKEYLDSIVAASGRMKHLIDDLLMLSRISRPTEAFKPINLNDLLNEIKKDVEFSLIRKNALLVIEDPFPEVIGNRTHLKILFQNLISNAIKFNNKERPVIEIGFQNTENNSYLFFVRDNGIGIEKDFQEKIFVIFQRLHPREEYEGTGAGLAIVKKIVEIHKGTIWVESTPNQGSTFYFTLPK